MLWPTNWTFTLEFIEDCLVLLNLRRQFEDYYWQQLQKLGVCATSESDKSDRPARAIYIESRLLPVRTWAVELSTELKSRMENKADFSNFEKIKQAAISGQNLNAMLSRSILKPDKEDLLFSDWGIGHLHLSDEIDVDGFTKRSMDLIFFFRTEETIYFIDILPHGNFSSQSLVEILHTNWPELISRFRMNVFAVSSGVETTDKEIHEIRNAGLQFAITMKDGTVYAPPGGGLTTARTSLKAGIAATQIHKRLYIAEQKLKKRSTEFKSLISKRFGRCPDVLILRIKTVDANRIYFGDHRCGNWLIYQDY